VQLITSTAIGNIFWPGEKPELTLQFVNLTDQPLATKGVLHLYQWGMAIGMDDTWKQSLFRIADCGTIPVEVSLPPKGFKDIVVKPVLPQIVSESGQSAPTMAEACWWPMRRFDKSMKKGAATGYVAADDSYFYFATKVADDTPHPGLPRYENLNAAKTELRWPEGVRRYRYWSSGFLPSGSWPACDNVQIAFQVFPVGHENKDDYPCPPGTLPGYIGYHDSATFRNDWDAHWANEVEFGWEQ